MADDDVHIETMSAKNWLPSCRVYKVVGSDPSLVSYNTVTAPLAADPGLSIAQREWICMYLQTGIEHAEGTVGYRWDKGWGQAHLLELSLCPDLRVIVFSGAFMGNGTVPGPVKALTAKKVLGLDPARPLMAQIGEMEPPTALVVPETNDGDIELLIPHSRLAVQPDSGTLLDEKILRTYHRPRMMGPATR